MAIPTLAGRHWRFLAAAMVLWAATDSVSWHIARPGPAERSAMRNKAAVGQNVGMGAAVELLANNGEAGLGQMFVGPPSMQQTAPLPGLVFVDAAGSGVGRQGIMTHLRSDDMPGACAAAHAAPWRPIPDRTLPNSAATWQFASTYACVASP